MQKKIFLTGLVTVLIFWGLGNLGLSPISFFNAALVDKANGSLEVPQHCMLQPDGYKRWACLGPYFEKLTFLTSARTAMVEATKFKEQGVVSDCHVFAHLIGEANLEKHDFDVGKAISSCTVGGCRYGCVHGVIGRYGGTEADPYNIISKMKNVCDSIEDDFPQKLNCVHGTGHGLLAHNYLSSQDAIYACRAFGERWTPFCIDGLAMQNMDQYLSLGEDHLREIIPRICDPFESVDLEISVDPRFSEYCITRVASGLLFYTGYDIERTEELCEELPQQDDINVCKNGAYEHIKRKKPSNIDMQKFLESPREPQFLLPVLRAL